MAQSVVIKSFGTILTDNKSVKASSDIFRSAPLNYNIKKLPKDFNGKYLWRYYLPPIKFQGYCGNCWAIACIYALSARFSLMSKSYIKPHLSSSMLTICDGIVSSRPETDDKSISEKNTTKHAKNSCFGNSISNALSFLYVYGAIDDICFNYGLLLEKGINIKLSQIQSAAELPKCQDILGNQFENCVSDLAIAAQYFRVSTFYKLDEDEQKIKEDIFKFGPLISGFILFDNFLNDYDGTTIYMGPKADSKPTGGHAIVVLGWGEEKVKKEDGTEENVKYWIIANSWGRNWGDDGFFKMKIGIKECELEKNFYGCIPDIPHVENPYTSDIGIRDPKLISERKKFNVDPQNFYLEKSIPLIKKGELLGNLEPIFPKNLGFNLKNFMAGRVKYFPTFYDKSVQKIYHTRENKLLKYILFFVLSFILTVLISYFIMKIFIK